MQRLSLRSQPLQQQLTRDVGLPWDVGRISRSSIRPLEFLATGHSVIALITCFPSTAQDISFL